LLFEMLDGHGDGPIKDGWRSQEVKDALDLCLACKGCKTDCPANVDMATYKAEFLAQHYRHRLRPRADYALGWLPAAAHLVARTGTARPLNALTRRRPVARLATAAAGLEDRPIPPFAAETLQQWWGRRISGAADAHRPAPRGRVLLWPDTFTNAFRPEVGRAAVEVLEAAGWEVEIPTERLCCGLTWISTGQLGIARRALRRTIRRLAPHVRDQGFVVGLEPSCTAVFRSDMHEFFPDDQDANRIKDHVLTLAELLTEHTPGWNPPQAPEGTRAIAQVHCHQHAIMKWDADQTLLEKIRAAADWPATSASPPVTAR
jgi:Fe-S oxidoreductase